MKLLTDNQRAKFYSILRIIAAVALLIVGLAGIVLPILPGWPFVILAIFILGLDERIILALNKNKVIAKIIKKINLPSRRGKK